jgi:hypothetical protein
MAELPTDEDWAGICWEKIVAKGRWRDLDWAREIEHILEMDIFDIPDAQFIERAKRNMTDPFLTHRLNSMASTRAFGSLHTDYSYHNPVSLKVKEHKQSWRILASN